MGIVTLIALLTAGAASAVAARKAKTSGQPAVQFREYVHDFGHVPEKGGAISHDFKSVNKGDGNYVIVDHTVECGCTRPDYPKDPIGPGKQGKVRVTYNPIGRPGPFEKVVTLKTNGHPRKVKLKIKGYVDR